MPFTHGAFWATKWCRRRSNRICWRKRIADWPTLDFLLLVFCFFGESYDIISHHSVMRHTLLLMHGIARDHNQRLPRLFGKPFGLPSVSSTLILGTGFAGPTPLDFLTCVPAPLLHWSIVWKLVGLRCGSLVANNPRQPHSPSNWTWRRIGQISQHHLSHGDPCRVNIAYDSTSAGKAAEGF